MDSRKAAHAVRFGVDVLTGVMQASASPQIAKAPTFPVRMLRWVSISPDGKRVAYQALGYVYVKDLPNGAPRRLTKQTDHTEYFPSWSRDSKSLVYSTWNDETLGSIRVATVQTGASRAVTDKPGHYLDPVFSPDATRIVYRKDTGGYLRSDAWSDAPGLYWIPAAGGGKPALITEDGSSPRFGKANDRVFFVKTEGGEDQIAPAKRVLASIKLDGSEPHEYYLSELATEFEISPDAKWLAFREGFNAYVTPFVETGRRVDIGPKSKAVPVTRVSKEAGEYLHFSGDSSRLYWAVGPQLFQRDLKEAFAFLPGAPEKLPEPPAKGLDIGFQAPVDVPSGSVAFTGGRVVTMNGAEIIEDGVVVVEANRIKAVGKRGQVTIPSGAKTIDVTGKTVLPGFIDAHYHGAFGGGDGILPQQNWHSDASLAFGVTTVHDPSNNTGEVFAAAELARAGFLRAPRLFSTGTILYGAADEYKAEIDSLDDALAHLRRMKAVGAISVKSYQQPRREQRQQILAAAREVGIMVVPEGGSLFEMNMSMVVDGHTTIEHTIPVPNIYADVHALWPPGQVGYTPTLLVATAGSSASSTGTRRPTSGRTRGSRRSCRASSSTRARAAAPWRPTTSSTTSTRRRSQRGSRRTASSSTPARTGSAKAWVCTGRSGCWCRAASRRTRPCAAPPPTARRPSGWTATSAPCRRASSPTSSSSTAIRCRTSASPRRWRGRWSTAASTTPRP